MSFRRRRVVEQKCSMTGKPKRPWRDGEPVAYNAAPGPKQKPKAKRAPLTGYALDLLSALHAVRLGIPLSPRGQAILQIHFFNTLHPQQT